MPSATDEKSVILKNLQSYPQIQEKLTWISKQIKKETLTHPLIAILLQHKPWQQRYLAGIDSALKILDGVPNLFQVTSGMENGDQFFDELSTIRLAGKYRRRGNWVEFIREEKGKQRPDFELKKDSKSDVLCVFEVKHITGKMSLDVLSSDIRKVVSPYAVRIETKEFELPRQARQLASAIISELGRLDKQGAKPTPSAPQVLTVEDSHAEIFVDPTKKSPETRVYLQWSSTEEVKERTKRLGRLADVIDGARDQLLNYLPKGVNIVALDADRAFTHDDDIDEILRSTPGLFKTDEYRNIAGVRLLSNVIPVVDVLFANSNNEHVNSGLLQSLDLSTTFKVVTWWSGPISSLPISESRRKEIIAALRKVFASETIGRRVLRVIPLQAKPSGVDGGDFQKIEIEEIIDRIWFVDLPPGSDGQYSVHGIGEDYGKAMAEAENEAVIDKLVEASSSSFPIISYKETLNPESLDVGIKTLRDDGFAASVVLTNIYDFTSLGLFSGFVRGTVPNTFLLTKSGDKIPVCDAREVPDDTTFVIDSKSAGALVLKEDLTAAISEISEEETAEILKAIPELTEKQLKEKVKVLVEEEFKIDIEQPKAILRMNRKQQAS